MNRSEKLLLIDMRKPIFLLFIVLITASRLFAQSFKEEFVQTDFSEMIQTAFNQFDNTHFTKQDVVHWTHYLSKLPTVATTNYYIRNAATEFDVPVVLLQAIGQVETNWTQIGPSIDKGWGIMHLTDNKYSKTLQQAAELLQLPTDTLKNNAQQNIRGMAALLSYYRGNQKINDLSDWFDVAKKVTGLYDDELSELQAKTYFDVIKNGIESHTLWGETIVIKPIDVYVSNQLDISNPLIFKQEKATLSEDYPEAITYLTPCNHTIGREGYAIDTWTNHWIGVGTYAGAISWFHNCSSKVSAHFVIKNDGEITQVVDVNDKAWHCGAYGQINNERSIGVEHEATLTHPDYWNNEAMLQASTKMARFFCDLYRIPKTRALPGIRGHQEMPGTSTDCPGTLPWDKWMSYLLSDENIVLQLPKNKADNVLFPVTFDWSRKHENNEHYRLQVATTDENFNLDSASMFPNPILDIVTDTSYYIWNDATANTSYYWAVQSINGDTVSYSSALGTFETSASNDGYPKLSISDYKITDVMPQGNNNGIAEADEQVLLSITLSNQEDFEVNNVSGTITTKDNDIQIITNNGNWEDIPALGQAESSLFECKISKYAISKNITFLLDIHANGKDWTTSFIIPINCFLPDMPKKIVGNPNICHPDCEVFHIDTDEQSIYNVWEYAGEAELSGKDNEMKVCPTSNGILKVRSNNMCGQSDWQTLEITLNEKPEKPTIYLSNDTLYCSAGERYEWYFYIDFITETDQSFYVPNKNGLYHAKIRENGCLSDASNFVRVYGLDGWEDIEEENPIQVYPNPFNRKIIIKNLDIDEVYNIELSDTNGHILTWNLLEKETIINTQHFASGIYFLKIYNRQKTYYQKLMKL